MAGKAERMPWSALAAAILLGAACGGGEPGGDGPVGPSPPPPPPSGSVGYTIQYATYLGGSDFEEIREPLLLPDGRLLFGARTKSADMPTTAGVVQPSPGGGEGDSYLAILSADGGALEAATYFGGSGMERPPYGIELASNGDIVFGSGTSSPNIPTSASAYRRDLAQPVPEPGDGYVCRISGDLRSLRWCTYTGGGWPRGGLAVDAQDNVIVAGRASGAFPTTSGVVQPVRRGEDDGFVLKLAPDGTRAVFSTLLGGQGSLVGEVVLSVRPRPDGALSISGISTSSDFPVTSGAAQTSSLGPKDSFVAALAGDGGALLYSTLLSGSDTDASEHRHWLLPDGSVLLAGITHSQDFPGGAPRGGSDGFAARIGPQGEAFAWVRTLGGSGNDLLLGPVVDGRGRIILFGRTTSRDLPVTSNAVQSTYGGGSGDGVVFVLGPDGTSVEMVTYLGGRGDEMIRGIVVGPSDELYLAGRTDSDDFPITGGALQRDRGGDSDGFVVKLVPSGG